MATSIRPITVLMSSHPNVVQRKQEFREKADLIEAAFQFEPKSNLTNTITARLKIRTIVALLGYIHEVQQYVQTLSNAASQAAVNFYQEIKALSIQDYAFIQQTRLNEEEHPLGDYMNWLYESRWGSLLFSNEPLRTSQQALDIMRIETGWLMSEMPSKHVANMYASALYEEPLDQLAPNPMVVQQANEPPKYFLHLGDIFSNPEKDQVWLVLNPQCDLERNVPVDRSILLLPGKLASLEIGHQPSGALNTELFLLNDKPYKIIWDPKRILSIPYGSISDWKHSESLTRNHRLKLPFALHIQQHWTSTITRVGLNAAPPLMQAVKVEIWARDYSAQKNPKLISSYDTGVFRVSLRENNIDVNKIGLTVEFAFTLLDVIRQYRTDLKVLKDSEQGNQLPNPNKDIGRISDLVERFDSWFFKNNSFTDPNTHQDAAITVASNWKKTPLNTPLLINILTKQEPASLNDNTAKPVTEISTSNATHP